MEAATLMERIFLQCVSPPGWFGWDIAHDQEKSYGKAANNTVVNLPGTWTVNQGQRISPEGDNAKAQLLDAH